MQSSINFSTLLILQLLIPSALCLAELPSFPPPPKELERLGNQFIVQFESTKVGEETKEIAHDGMDDDVNVIKKIPSRNIDVLKFPTKEAAEAWREKNLKGIKYFEEGKMNSIFPSDHRHNLRRPFQITRFRLSRVH